MSKRKSAEVVEDETPVVTTNGWRKHRSRRQLRKQGMVNFRHLDNPPRRMRTLLVYLVIAVVAFWFLHFVLKIG